MFTQAIVRKPPENFAAGITTASLGVPEYARTLEQHVAYVRALESCGLSVTVLQPDAEHPDSTFVEDTAVVVSDLAILTRPGAASRTAEVARIRETIASKVPKVAEIVSPGTVDGGDVCGAGEHFFIGISQRTNEEGGRQLARLLSAAGFSTSFIDLREMRDILHLKSGLAYLGDKDLVLWDELIDFPQFRGYNRMPVAKDERYAANCVRVNHRVLVAAGFPGLAEAIVNAGYHPLVLEMSEFRKMDGGLSCLSLRF